MESISISILTKLPFLSLDKFVNLYVCGIIQIWKPFFVLLDRVNEIPFIHIEAFSITFSEIDGQAKIHFGWELVRFEIPFKVL